MKNTEHCLICENRKIDFQTGVYCGITDKKPKFLDKCRDKMFEKTMHEKVTEKNNNLKLIQNKKKATYFHLYTFLTIATIVLIADFCFIDYLWGITSGSSSIYISSYYVVAVPIIIAAIGFSLIPFAIAPLNKYKNHLKIANDYKLKLDSVLNLYEISYEISSNLSEGAHNIIDIENTVVFTKNDKVESELNFSNSNVKLTIDY